VTTFVAVLLAWGFLLFMFVAGACTHAAIARSNSNRVTELERDLDDALAELNDARRRLCEADWN
jgi:hypothetical protein